MPKKKKMTGKQVARRRKAAELTQDQLAADVYLTGKYRRHRIAEYERGARPISERMAALFDAAFAKYERA